MTVRPFPRHDDDKDAIAGRELDTVVAEKVMELRTTGRGDRHLVSGYDDPEGWGHPDNVWEDVPHYSTDIVAAWMIVGKLIAEDRQVTLSHRGRNDQWLWHASISEAGSGLGYGGRGAVGESAALAEKLIADTCAKQGIGRQPQATEIDAAGGRRSHSQRLPPLQIHPLLLAIHGNDR